MNINNVFIYIKVKMHYSIALFLGLACSFLGGFMIVLKKTTEFIEQMGMITVKSGFLYLPAISGRASYLDFFFIVRLMGENPFFKSQSRLYI